MSKPNVNAMRFVKKESDVSLRNVICDFAEDGENVGDLITRAVKAGLGTDKSIRSAIYLGAKSKSARFKLVE